MEDITLNYLIIFISILITTLSQIFISLAYSKYKKILNNKDLSGYDVARKILDSNNLDNIMILETRGNLTDHYDPQRKVIKLSTDIYHGSSIAGAAVAAHECGHAIQDKEGYLFLRIRSFIYPIFNLGTKIAYIILIFGFIFESMQMIYAALAIVLLGLIFQLITLPVEINASKRASKEIDENHLGNTEDKNGIKDMLISAALTYVAGVLSSALDLLRLLLILGNNRRD